jgi:hypothetical protein
MLQPDGLEREDRTGALQELRGGNDGETGARGDRLIEVPRVIRQEPVGLRFDGGGENWNVVAVIDERCGCEEFGVGSVGDALGFHLLKQHIELFEEVDVGFLQEHSLFQFTGDFFENDFGYEELKE